MNHTSGSWNDETTKKALPLLIPTPPGSALNRDVEDPNADGNDELSIIKEAIPPITPSQQESGSRGDVDHMLGGGNKKMITKALPLLIPTPPGSGLSHNVEQPNASQNDTTATRA